MDIEHLLTTTRSARKSLDLDAPVDIDDIRESLRVGLQAANGSNQQSWRWLVVTDAELREQLAGLYRDAYLLRVGGQMLGDLLPTGTPEGRLMSSTEWLVENLAKVPVLVIPVLPAVSAAHRRRRIFLPGHPVRLDLPCGMELPARAACSRLWDMCHDAALAAVCVTVSLARSTSASSWWLTGRSGHPASCLRSGPQPAPRRG